MLLLLCMWISLNYFLNNFFSGKAIAMCPIFNCESFSIQTFL